MGTGNNANYTVIHHLGAGKEAAGRLTGYGELKRAGQRDQAQAKLQEAGEKVKDSAVSVGENFKDAGRKI